MDECAKDDSQRREEDKNGEHFQNQAAQAVGTPAAAGRTVFPVARENIFAMFAAYGGQGHRAEPTRVW